VLKLLLGAKNILWRKRMKKKIALFLAAALLSVGLIVSCGGGDDDGDGNGPGTNPNTPGATEYTVTFDTDGGEPAIEPIKVKAGTAVGAATWPADPTRDTDVFDGWYEGANKFTASTKIEKT